MLKLTHNLMVLILSLSSLVAGQAMAGDNPLMEQLPPGEREYKDKIFELNATENEIIKLEERFNILVQQKRGAQDQETIRTIIEEMSQIKRERDMKSEKYNELAEELKYKYPDKGRAISRRYAPIEKKSLKQLEKPSKLKEELSKIKQLVDLKYKPFVDEAKAKEEARQAKMRVIRKEVAPSDAPPPKKRIMLER